MAKTKNGLKNFRNSDNSEDREKTIPPPRKLVMIGTIVNKKIIVGPGYNRRLQGGRKS